MYEHPLLGMALGCLILAIDLIVFNTGLPSWVAQWLAILASALLFLSAIPTRWRR